MFGRRWQGLTAAQKEEYKLRAANLEAPSNLTWKKREWHRIARKMYSAVKYQLKDIKGEIFSLCLNVI